ncbi:MAG: rRNA maturation RNase YbeY [Pseudomonadota bacterium]
MVTVDLQVAVDSNEAPGESEIQSLVAAVLREARSEDEGEFCVRVVASDEMRALNRDYRGADKPTNVLSFPAEPLPGQPDDEEPFFGDIVVCAEVVAAEAAAQGKAVADHWAHMIVHGTLHLLGWDHVQDEAAEDMERLETRILADRGVANPYASRA